MEVQDTRVVPILSGEWSTYFFFKIIIRGCNFIPVIQDALFTDQFEECNELECGGHLNNLPGSGVVGTVEVDVWLQE